MVTAINCSTQMKEQLLQLQTDHPPAPPAEQKAVTVIQDVATRWWSTYSMCERLIRLKPYLTMMVISGRLPAHINDAQWALLADITKRLEPFMVAQRFLEGEKYVTISFVPTLISAIRTSLTAAIDAPDNSAYMTHVLTTLEASFCAEWGSGDLNTMYDEHLTTGPRNRHKGFRPLVMVAAFLDPRTKQLLPFGDEDKQKIHTEVKRRARWIYVELHETAAAAAATAAAATAAAVAAAAAAAAAGAGSGAAEAAAAAGGGGAIGPPRPAGVAALAAGARTVRREQLQYDDILGDLDAADNAGGGLDGRDLDNAPREVLPATAVQDEFDAYIKMARLPRLDRRPDASVVINDPLLWWKEHARELPTLSELARRVLCIPATSAPSERVFSVAGLTIAKDRARLLPEVAADMVYLHEAWPVVDAIIARKRDRED
jgi:hypothetical protein